MLAAGRNPKLHNIERKIDEYTIEFKKRSNDFAGNLSKLPVPGLFRIVFHPARVAFDFKCSTRARELVDELSLRILTSKNLDEDSLTVLVRNEKKADLLETGNITDIGNLFVGAVTPSVGTSTIFALLAILIKRALNLDVTPLTNYLDSLGFGVYPPFLAGLLLLITISNYLAYMVTRNGDEKKEPKEKNLRDEYTRIKNQICKYDPNKEPKEEKNQIKEK